MNKTIGSTVVALLLAGNSVMALPVYTFAGSVTSSNYAGLRVGQGIAYCIQVDFNEQGYYYPRDFSTRLYLSEADNGLLDEYFVADYLHGSAMPADIPMREDIHTDEDKWEFHMVAQSPTGGVAFYVSNSDRAGIDMIAITGSGYLSEWTAGQSVSAWNHVAGDWGYGWDVSSSLTLVSVSDDQPVVPEPSAMALFGLGLIGLTGGILRKTKPA